MISPSHVALLGPVSSVETGPLALGPSRLPSGPDLVLRDTGWDDLGQGQETSTRAACLPHWARPGVTQALAASSRLD